MKKWSAMLLLLCLSGGFFLPACQKELPPIAIEIVATPLGGNAPLDVNFQASVLSGQVTDYSWDFGDGATATGASAFHRYTTAGEYTARLTVKGQEGTEKNPQQVSKTAQTVISVYQANIPPVAGFQYSPSSGIIADQTVVHFSNTTSGTSTAWQWDLGANETSTTLQNPNYQFNYAGVKTISLTATGPAGTSSTSKSITVHAMDPACNNYTGGSTQSASAIQTIRNNGQSKIGWPIIKNNYGGSVKVELFVASDWLNGVYTPYANVYWTVNAVSTTTLLYNGQHFNIGNDWGVRVSFSNGVVSCIRTVDDVSTYSNGNFTIDAGKVYEGF